MTVVNYPRHVAFLALAAVIEFAALWSIDRWHPPFVVGSLTAHFALNGLLYGAALVLSLNLRASRLRRAAFVAIAAVLSFLAPYAGILLPSAVLDHVGLLFPSAVGAAAYWYLVRLFWIHELTVMSLARALVLCSVVSLIWLKANDFVWFPDPLSLMAHTLSWWGAFSFSLYLYERTGSAPAKVQAEKA